MLGIAHHNIAETRVEPGYETAWLANNKETLLISSLCSVDKNTKNEAHYITHQGLHLETMFSAHPHCHCSNHHLGADGAAPHRLIGKRDKREQISTTVQLSNPLT